MNKFEIQRNGKTDQYSIVLIQGDDTVRCMVTVDSGYSLNNHSDEQKRFAALTKAKALAKALDAAIDVE